MRGSEPGPLPVSQAPGPNALTAFPNRRALSKGSRDLSLSERHRQRMSEKKNRNQTSARVLAGLNRSGISERGGVQEGGSLSPCDAWGGPRPGSPRSLSRASSKAGEWRQTVVGASGIHRSRMWKAFRGGMIFGPPGWGDER